MSNLTFTHKQLLLSICDHLMNHGCEEHIRRGLESELKKQSNRSIQRSSSQKIFYNCVKRIVDVISDIPALEIIKKKVEK